MFAERVIDVSGEDFMRYINMDLDDPELTKWMNENGIEFDSGLVEVNVDGERKMMDTSRADFGTLEGSK